jgi:hypothetical protein
MILFTDLLAVPPLKMYLLQQETTTLLDSTTLGKRLGPWPCGSRTIKIIWQIYTMAINYKNLTVLSEIFMLLTAVIIGKIHSHSVMTTFEISHA